MKKEKDNTELKEQIAHAIGSNYNTEYMYWSGELDSFWNGGLCEDDFDDEEEYNFFLELGTLDHWVANAFRCTEQLLLLLAEKEGVLPNFSEGLSDDTEICEFYNTEIEEGNCIFEAAFDACCKKYGFSFPEHLNYSPYRDGINNDPDKLDACILEKLGLEEAKSAEKVLEAIENGLTSEEINDALSDMSFEYVVCLSNEKANKLIRKYSRLSSVHKKKIKNAWDIFSHNYRDLLLYHKAFDFSWDDENVISKKISNDFYLPISFVSAPQTYYGGDDLVMRPRMIYDKSMLFTMERFANETIKEFEAVLLPEFEAWKAGASHRKAQNKYYKKKKAERAKNKLGRRRKRRYVKKAQSQETRAA